MQFFKSYINITVGKRLKNVYMCKFLLFFLNIFLFCSTIATKYVCKVSKDHTWWFPCYINCCRKNLNNVCRYEFLSLFYNSFFILLYYIYKIHLQKFKRPCWWFSCYINCCRKKLNNVCRYKFLSVFLNSFFILLYYSYKMSNNQLFNSYKTFCLCDTLVTHVSLLSQCHSHHHPTCCCVGGNMSRMLLS